MNNGLDRTERVKSLTLTNELFTSGSSRHAAAYPIAAVFTLTERKEGMAPVMIITSVSKRLFHHAVDRNRVKRQLREAYRLNKTLLAPLAEAHPAETLLLAFIYKKAEHTPSDELHKRMRRLLHLVADHMKKEEECKRC